MRRRTWFHPWLVIYLIAFPGRKALPWVLDNLDVIIPLIALAAFVVGLFWALHPRRQNPALAAAPVVDDPGIRILEVQDRGPRPASSAATASRGT